jgi:hypothetical protein
MDAVDIENIIIVPKKKRGRKPKDTTNPISILPTQNIHTTDTKDKKKDKEIDTKNNDIITNVDSKSKIENEIDALPKKGKRGRKPKAIYTSYELPSNDDANITSLSDDENVIVRLNILDNNLDEEQINEEHPYAYNHDTYSNISNISDMVLPASISEEHNSNPENLRIISILKDFEEKNKNKEWPLNTSISCYWCCHRFENAPFGVPINYKNGTFEVYGCFCSLECTASYNFDTYSNQDEMWERYHLMNVMSRKMNLGNIVKCAPPRLSLKLFGGYLDIDAFRNYNTSKKIINLNFPPMTSITQQLEEINDFEFCSDFKFIPVDSERITKYKEKIVFRRTKPLVDTNKSLETSMNLKYS